MTQQGITFCAWLIIISSSRHPKQLTA